LLREWIFFKFIISFVSGLNTLTEILSQYENCSLKSIEQVAFYHRVDTKYVIPSIMLRKILNSFWKNYYVLNINGLCSFDYSTVYYDTPEMKMFVDHVRGKLNRYKLRRRNYLSTKISFLEVKFKSNTGRTLKWRIPGNEPTQNFTEKDQQFLKRYFPYPTDNLRKVIQTNFTRITLIDKDFTQRITLDYDLSFLSLLKRKHPVHLPGLAVIEMKDDRNKNENGIKSILKSNGYYSGGFSKYCIGMAMTNSNLKKQGALKSNILKVNKLLSMTV